MENTVDPYYLNIVEELSDFYEWCISDNGSWGIPIPFFVDTNTHEILMNEQIVEHFAQLVEIHGSSDIWYSFSVKDLLPNEYQNIAEKYKKGYQVFDSWFDSSLSWDFDLGEVQETKTKTWDLIQSNLK